MGALLNEAPNFWAVSTTNLTKIIWGTVRLLYHIRQFGPSKYADWVASVSAGQCSNPEEPWDITSEKNL